MSIVGIYGDEVSGLTSVSSIVDYFKSNGLTVKDVSGNMDHGWEMTLIGDPRKIFFAVCNKIPGYNSDSVQDFIDEYSLDESKDCVTETVVNQVLTGKTLTEALESKPAWQVIDINWVDSDGEWVDIADLPDEYVIPAGELSINVNKEDVADWLTQHLAGSHNVVAGLDLLAKPLEEEVLRSNSVLTQSQLDRLDSWWDGVLEDFSESFDAENHESSVSCTSDFVVFYGDAYFDDQEPEYFEVDDFIELLTSLGIQVGTDVVVSRDSYTGGSKIQFKEMTPEQFVDIVTK